MPVNGLQGNPSITRSYWHELLWPQTGSCFLATHPNFLILIKIIHFLKSLFTAGRWKVIYPCWWNSPPWKKALVGVKWNSKTSPPHKGALFVRCINLSLLSNHLWSTQSGSLPVASSSEVCEGWMWIPGEPTPWASCQERKHICDASTTSLVTCIQGRQHWPIMTFFPMEYRQSFSLGCSGQSQHYAGAAFWVTLTIPFWGKRSENIHHTCT